MLWLLILPLLAIPAYGDADCDATAFVQSSVEGLVKPHAAPLKAEAKAKAKTQAAPAACKDMIKAMGRGINIGNTYDMEQDERSPMEVQKRVRWIKDQGFQHLRLPVTWGDRFDSSSLLTKNVTEVVDYALELGLYVVINTHHEMWLKDHYDGSEQFNSKFWKLWHDIAVHFQDRDRRLIFEILNEPEHKFGSWGGGQWPHPFDENAIRLTKEINNVGYDAVRQVSKDRMVFVSPNAQASKGTASSVYPNLDSLPGGGHDECLGVEVHTYDPWAFAGDTGQNSFYGTIPQMKKGLYDEFRSLHEWQFTSNVPLYVGEFGVGRRECCQGERNAEIVKEYYRFAMHHFLSNDWAACAWDDPGWFAIYHKAEEMHGKGEGIHDYLVKGY